MAEEAIRRLAVIDDHRLFLSGFSLLLEQLPQPFEVAAFEEPVELLKKTEAGELFDLIICDLVMPSMNGLAFAKAMRDVSGTPILILSGINNQPPLAEMQKLGVQGFVHKSASDDVLLNAILAILDGKTCFPESVEDDGTTAAENYGDVKEPINAESVPVLTARQVEVLGLISNGASNAEISVALGISENTVKTHLKQIFELLQVNKRTACVRAAQSLGLI